jgi:hypothetical protein
MYETGSLMNSVLFLDLSLLYSAFYHLTKSHFHFRYHFKKLRFKWVMFLYSVFPYSHVFEFTLPLEKPF